MKEKNNKTVVKRCKWCNKEFITPKTRKYNAVKYCCKMHSYYAYLEQHNKAQHKYIRKYKELFKNTAKLKGSIGLGAHREKDFMKEYKKIQKELKLRGLR